MFLSNRRGFARLSLLIIVGVVASTAFTVGFFSGFLKPSERQTASENLSISNMTSALSGNNLTLGFLVSNNGTADARLEYIVINETAVTVGVSGKIVPYESHIAISLNLDESIFKPNTAVKLRLHTANGYDFIQIVTIPDVPEDNPPPIIRLEKIEVQSATATKAVDGSYTITLAVKNTGSADATIDSVMINGKPLSQFPGVTDNLAVGGTSVVADGSASVNVSVPAGQGVPFTAGTTIEIKLHTEAGKDYPQMLTLP